MPGPSHVKEPLASGERTRGYRVVEGLHLRQWALRTTVPLAILAANRAGHSALRVDIGWLPGADAPWLGGPTLDTAARAAGVLLVVTAAVLRVHAKGVLVRKTALTTGGAYRLVRHPFYLANLIGAVGVFALAGTLGLVYGAAWTLFAAPVYLITVRGEEDGLRTLYGSSWEAFTRRVPGLIPRPWRLGPRPAAAVRVTWENLVREHEPARLPRFLAGALTVAAVAAPATVGEVVLCLAVLLFVLSHAAPSVSRRQERMSE